MRTIVCAHQVELEATFGRLRKHAATDEATETENDIDREVYRVDARDGQLLLALDSLECVGVCLLACQPAATVNVPSITGACYCLRLRYCCRYMQLRELIVVTRRTLEELTEQCAALKNAPPAVERTRASPSVPDALQQASPASLQPAHDRLFTV